ncbi:MAG: hypothetical protein GXO26_00300 [Crenarchaeota archaeon]|nr:hypothetical protein [Thermoproteota archaeon]
MALTVLRGSAKTCIPVERFIEVLRDHGIDCSMIGNVIICVGENIFLWSSGIERTLEESKIIPVLEDGHAKIMHLITNLIESVDKRDHLSNIKTVKEMISYCTSNVESALLLDIALKELEDSLKSSLNSCIILQRTDNNFLRILVKKCCRVKRVEFLLVLDLKNKDNSKMILDKISNIFRDLGIKDIRFLRIKAEL